MAVAHISGILRRRLILDLGIGLSIGFGMANAFWYGWHVPRTVARDDFYTKLEAKRSEEKP